MTNLRTRAGAFFLAPTADTPPHTVVAPPAVALAAVVAAPADARAAASAVAAQLRRAGGAGTAVVCAAASAPAEGPRCRSAARLARRLGGRDLAATAAGGLCHVALPADTQEGLRDVWRTLAAAGTAPVVVAMTERTDDVDAFLAQADRLYLATAVDDDCAALALGSLARLGPPTTLVAPPRGAVARRAAMVGLRRPAYSEEVVA